MQAKRLKLIQGVIGMGMALAVSACASPAGRGPSNLSTDQPASGPQRMTLGLNGVPTTFSAKLNSAGGGNQKSVGAMAQLLSAGLTMADPQGNLQPQLAETVPTVENGLWKVLPDGRMELTWKIRPGARWHDGAPFTAEDLVFTLAVARDREIVAFSDTGLTAIDRAAAVDPTTVVVSWKQPQIDADLLFTARLALPLPKHLLDDALTSDKANFAQLAYWSAAFVGNGPYQLKDWEVGGYTALLEANPSYVLGRPKIDQIEVKFFTDTNALIVNVLSGAVDLVPGSQTLSADQGMQVKSQWRDGEVDLTASAGRENMYPNLESPSPTVIGDVRFRRALMHATNRQLIADSVGGVNPTDSFLDRDDPDYQAVASSAVLYGYDTRKATQLMDEMGFAKSSDGFYQDSTGQRLKVESRTPGAFDIGVKVQIAIADNWKQLGVDVDQVAIPAQQAQDKLYRATFPGFEMVHNPTDLRGLKYLYSTEAVGLANNYLGKNRSRYKSAELDGLIDRVYVTIPRAERQQILARIVNLISDQLLIMFMPDTSNPQLIGNRVQYVGPTLNIWNIEQWKMR